MSPSNEEDKISSTDNNSNKPSPVPDDQLQPDKSTRGEFTRIFQSPKPAPSSSGTPAPTSTPSASSNAPGEFTKFFDPPRPPSPPPVHVTPPSPDDMEKWLRSLEFDDQSPPEPHVPIAPTPSPLPSNIPSGPGEFTIITAGRSAPTTTPSPATAPKTSAQVTPVQMPPVAPVIPSVLVPSVPPVPSVSLAQPPVPVVPPAQPEKHVSYMPLIIIFNVLFLLAVCLVLYFALRH